MTLNFALIAAAVLVAGSSPAPVARQEAPQPQPAAFQPDSSLAQPQTAALPWMATAVAHQWNADRVKEAQTGLRNAKLYGGRISGVFDAETRNAVREFQRLHNLPVTGTLSDSLLATLMQVRPQPCAQMP
jgi:peptidoglycan hydrolase-like protein with peptidoglycan-binding domain